MINSKIYQLIVSTFVLYFSITVAYSQSVQTYYCQSYEAEPISESYFLNNKKDSILNAYYINDSLAYSYKVYNGKPSGIYRVYYTNGTLKYRGVFMNGVLNGSWKEFNNTGNLIVTGQYLFGKRDGSWFYFEDKKVQVYKNGTPSGRWRLDEGWIPRTLFVFKKGVLLRSKREFPKENLFR